MSRKNYSQMLKSTIFRSLQIMALLLWGCQSDHKLVEKRPIAPQPSTANATVEEANQDEQQSLDSKETLESKVEFVNDQPTKTAEEEVSEKDEVTKSESDAMDTIEEENVDGLHDESSNSGYSDICKNPNDDLSRSSYNPIDCPNVTIYNMAFGGDYIPGCVGERPPNSPVLCNERVSIVGNHIYAQRLKLKEDHPILNEKLSGWLQATTITTMPSSTSNYGSYKNVIVAISEYPGDFDVKEGCRDIAPKENSEISVVSSLDEKAVDKFPKACIIKPGKLYYINTKHAGGMSSGCGIDSDIVCWHQVPKYFSDGFLEKL